MARLTFAKDIPAALKGADAAFVVGSASHFAKGKAPKLFSPKTQKQLAELAGRVKPGAHGQLASTYTQSNPARLVVGIRPGPGSRYNAPSRADGMLRLLQTAGLSSEKKVALIVLLEDDAHLDPMIGAIARAHPLLSRRSRGNNQRVQIAFVDSHGEFLKATPEMREQLKCVQEAARLVDSPPTEMNPEGLAAAARELLDGIPDVAVEEYVGEQLVERGLMGIYSVGKAALSAPRMLVATYSPPEPSGTTVAMVGKGVTFDTGGLHLKPRGAMETMKCDMGGSAAVLGAFRLLAKTRATNHTVHLIMCMAENAIGAGSFKPDDIIEMHSGKTVEVNNTDAEGRLLLGDGVSWAARELKVDVVFDAATLTGAQMVATGANHAAVMSNDADLERLAVECGQSSADLVHPLPFAPEFYKGEFKSQIADMKNSVKNRANAQSSCAAQFVYNHLDGTKVRWLHVDLAGPSFRNERGTGFGVALLRAVVGRL